MPDRARAVIEVLLSYRLFYAVKALEVTAGVLLLSNRRVNLALALLGPILFNIAWFDAALDPTSLPVAVVLLGLYAVLLRAHWGSFRPLVASTT